MKKADLKQIILNLLDGKETITLREIAQAISANAIQADNRTIQRALADLIHEQTIEVHGAARSRMYKKYIATSRQSELNAIPLSKQSRVLLNYLSQPVLTRQSVGYQANFLQAYEPNKTAYLSDTVKQALQKIGVAEKISRPAGTYARTIFNRLLIDLSWNSSRLEGNTYSLLETQRLIELGETAPEKNATETQMILNHKNAIEYILDSVDEKKITAHEIRSIHALLSENLLGDSSACGRIRNIAVGVSETAYTPLGNPHLLQEYFNLFIEKINLIQDPFEQSFFSLVHISYLQAFEDVNKRTARLTANIPLMKHNLKPLSFIDVNQTDYVTALLGVYEKNDVSLLCDFYRWAYQRSAERYSTVQKNIGEPDLFKLKYREQIHSIVRNIILEKTPGKKIVPALKRQIDALMLTEFESTQLLQLIESEIMNLHDGNIARYKIRPAEFQAWHQKK